MQVGDRWEHSDGWWVEVDSDIGSGVFWVSGVDGCGNFSVSGLGRAIEMRLMAEGYTKVTKEKFEPVPEDWNLTSGLVSFKGWAPDHANEKKEEKFSCIYENPITPAEEEARYRKKRDEIFSRVFG
jgi:hypothetical protein